MAWGELNGAGICSELLGFRMTISTRRLRARPSAEVFSATGWNRQLRETMDAMAPIVAQSYELRRRQPELGAPLDLYKSHLNEVQSTLEQIRVTLLVRQASLRASQSHMNAVSRWAATFTQTH